MAKSELIGSLTGEYGSPTRDPADALEVNGLTSSILDMERRPHRARRRGWEVATWDDVQSALEHRPDVAEIVGWLITDVAVTLGWSREVAGDFVIDTASVVLFALDDPAWPFVQRVIENTQQRIHDEFIDTTWPACPIHRTHPLLLGDGPPWRWEGCVSLPVGEVPRPP